MLLKSLNYLLIKTEDDLASANSTVFPKKNSDTGLVYRGDKNRFEIVYNSFTLYTISGMRAKLNGK